MNTTKPLNPPADKTGASDAHPVDLALQISNTDKAIRQKQRDARNGQRQQQGSGILSADLLGGQMHG